MLYIRSAAGHGMCSARKLTHVCLRLAVACCATMQPTTATIADNSVVLLPSAARQMTAMWTDSPQTGARYILYIMTNYRDPPSSTVHKKELPFRIAVNHLFVIGDFNRHEFVAANSITNGTFPGFQMGQTYRCYVQYFSSTGVKLNTNALNGFSAWTTPMQQASPPLAVQEFVRSDIITTVQAQPFSIRVAWQKPLSRGYANYLPPNQEQIQYYRIEVSETQHFTEIAAKSTCRQGSPLTAVCDLDNNIALVAGLHKAQVYFFRVVAGTIIGDGEYSTIASAHITSTPVVDC